MRCRLVNPFGANRREKHIIDFPIGAWLSVYGMFIFVHVQVEVIDAFQFFNLEETVIRILFQIEGVLLTKPIL